MARLRILVTDLIRSSLDNYVLPGTLSGTEILWLYLVHWKRDLVAVVAAIFCLLLSTPGIFVPEHAVLNGDAGDEHEHCLLNTD